MLALLSLPAMLNRLRRWRGDHAVSSASELCPDAGDTPVCEVQHPVQPRSDCRVGAGDPRPLEHRFHSAGSSETEAQWHHQLSELRQLVAQGEHGAVVERLGPELLAPLAAQLTPAAGFHLAQVAFEQERHDLAVPLLARVAAGAEPEEDLVARAQLLLGLSHQALGRAARARGLLVELVDQHQGHPAAVEAQLVLVWLHLQAGEIPQASDQLALLQAEAQASDSCDAVDHLHRVLHTMEWMADQPRELIPSRSTRGKGDAVAAGLDRVWMSRCGRILQLKGWMADPAGQVCGLCLVRDQRVWSLRLDQVRGPATCAPDELVTASGCDPGDVEAIAYTHIDPGESVVPLQPNQTAELIVLLRNGTQFCLRLEIEALPLTTDLIKAGFETAFDHHGSLRSPSQLFRARQLLRVYLQTQLQGPVQHQLFGTPCSRPELSVVVPLYGRIDFMEYQLNWFNAWQRRKGGQRSQFQLIYVLDDPRLTQECVALARRCAMLYSVPFELVLNPANLGYAGATNRGVAMARAPVLLLLNSDVLPAHDDSLELMLGAMQQHAGRIGALGARLLLENGAIQHQGMAFVLDHNLEGALGQVWLNDHPLKGLKVLDNAYQRPELVEVEAVTGACLMVERERLEQIGGLSRDYIVGDFEDSDLCLKLRRQGLPTFVDRAASFYHLERESLALLPGSSEARTKIVAANAVTHHQLWCSTIERLQRTRMHG